MVSRRSALIPDRKPARSRRKPIAIDLFSGCGGLTLGLKQAGFSVKGAVEIDPLSVETYRLNHKRVHVWETDIRKLSVSAVLTALKLRPGDLDLLAGCPPCQGFSSMRTLNGSRSVDDDRNDLLFDLLRFVRGLKPKAVMMENVPGLAKDVRFRTFVGELRKLGYILDYRVLNAADYGVPQSRRRLILMAARRKTVSFAPSQNPRPTVEEAISILPRPELSDDPLHQFAEKRSGRVLEIIARIPKDGGSRAALGVDAQLKCHQTSDGFKDVYGRMAWHKPAPTITGGCTNPSKGRFLHPEQNRAITLREAALLQSFPPTYKVSLKRGKFAAADLIGNALPPEFVRRHAEQLIQSLPNRAPKVLAPEAISS